MCHREGFMSMNVKCDYNYEKQVMPSRCKTPTFWDMQKCPD